MLVQAVVGPGAAMASQTRPPLMSVQRVPFVPNPCCRLRPKSVVLLAPSTPVQLAAAVMGPVALTNAASASMTRATTLPPTDETPRKLTVPIVPNLAAYVDRQNREQCGRV